MVMMRMRTRNDDKRMMRTRTRNNDYDDVMKMMGTRLEPWMR